MAKKTTTTTTKLITSRVDWRGVITSLPLYTRRRSFFSGFFVYFLYSVFSSSFISPDEFERARGAGTEAPRCRRVSASTSLG